jgi:hypothetical protein
MSTKCDQCGVANPADIHTCGAGVQPAPVQPVAWKHDCAALLQNDVELWVDRCPHCGKPRTTPPAPAVPDAITDNSESPEYRTGWNDCRAEMLKGMKP